MPKPGFNYKRVAENELPRSMFPFSHICISTACISTTNVSAGINVGLYVGIYTCILHEVFSQSIVMNANTPKPNPQAALLMFALITHLFVITNQSQGSHSKNTCKPMLRGSRSCKSSVYKNTLISIPRESTCCSSRRVFQANKPLQDFSRLWIILEEAVGSRLLPSPMHPSITYT